MTDPTASVRRTWWRPGRIALVVLLLVAVGGGAGWVLGGLDAPAGGSGALDGGTPGGDPTGGPPDTTADPGGDGSDATTEPPECLEHSERVAVRQYDSPGGLEGIYYLRGVHEDRPDWRIEVWICRDANGDLFYQGHNGTPEQRNLLEGVNALLLPVDLTDPDDEGRYEAFDRRGGRQTRYRVDVADCEVEIGREDFRVTYAQPGGGCG